VSRRIQWVLLGLGLVAISLTLARNWTGFQEALTINPTRMLSAVAICLVGIVLLGWSWAVIHPPTAAKLSLVRRFVLAQPGKYVPGGIAMPVGQVMLSKDQDTSGAASVARLLLHSATMVAGGLIASGALAVSEDRRLVALAAFSLGLLLAGWLAASDVSGLFNALGRTISRIRPVRIPELPGLGLKVRVKIFALVISCAGLTALGIAFAVLDAAGIAGSTGAAVGAFTLAWTVGFVAVPIPAGAGIREAALIFAVGAADPGGIIAVAVLHRLSMLMAEAIGFATGLAGERNLLRRRGPPSDRA
jgi:hypothetical protein